MLLGTFALSRTSLCVCVFARIGSSADSCGFRVLWTQISVKYLEAEAQLGKAETHADFAAAYALLLSFSFLFFSFLYFFR